MKKKSCDGGWRVAIAAARVGGSDICKQMVGGSQELDRTGRIRRRRNSRRKQERGGGPITLSHAFEDYVDEDGARRAAFVPGALNWPRGVDVGSSAFLPWPEREIGPARSLFGDVDFEVHLDNSPVRIYSADFNPRDSRRRRRILFGKPCRYAKPCGERMGAPRW